MLVVDGEAIPHEPIQVECHRGLARIFSETGSFFPVSLDVPPSAPS